MDPTWDNATALIWSTVETDVGVFCACITVMAPLLPPSCLGRAGTSKLRDTASYGSSSYGRKSSNKDGSLALSYMPRKKDISTDWQDDEHRLVGPNDYTAIKCTTEFVVSVHSNQSLNTVEEGSGPSSFRQIL